MTDPIVTRLHRCLVEAVRRRGLEPLEGPFKVSELYQEFVPYREVRTVLGVELNADYEHALLRLLAGEGGLLRLEPESAREELRREVESPYPFVGMYRKFSASDVWITADVADAPSEARAAAVEAAETEEVPAAPSGPRPAAPAPPVASPHAHAPADRPAPAHHHDHAPPRPVRTEERRGAEHRVVSRGVECSFCNQPLPVGRRVSYCPFCGSDQRLRPCPRCDEVLERTWRFCINCGLEVPIVASPRPPDPDE